MQKDIENAPIHVAKLDIRTSHVEKFCNVSILLSMPGISSAGVLTLQFCTHQDK